MFFSKLKSSYLLQISGFEQVRLFFLNKKKSSCPVGKLLNTLKSFAIGKLNIIQKLIETQCK